jgi:uncharacterized protein
MALFKLFGKGKDKKKRQFTRVFFATDLHGSCVTYRKLLKAASAYDTKMLIMGGDVVGKLLIPIISSPDGRKRVTLHGQLKWLENENDLKSIIENIELLGFYYVPMTEEEFKAVQGDQQKIEALVFEKAKVRLADWIKLADERLQDSGAKLYVTGGNDDPVEAVEFMEAQQTDHFLLCEEKTILLDEIHKMVSLGISNPTPWDTPREYPEDVIAEKIEGVVEGIEDFTNVIFNFHIPPYNSGLDSCPELDTSKDPPEPILKGGQQVFKPVGSHSVLAAIEKHQPLLALCGHIREARGTARIGRTLVINPGSEYGEGVLKGAIVNLGDGEVMSWQLTSG